MSSAETTVSSADTTVVTGLDRAPGWADLTEIDRFAGAIERYLAGDLDAEAFRRLRIWHGVYGQRQLTDVQMIRTKIPGGALSALALDSLADVAQHWSRGWGHITTRQNIEFHFVALRDVPAALASLATGGLTSREACGDTVRNVTACQLAGVCRSEVTDVSAAAEALARHFLRSPLTQSLARKFKIALSGCAVDCAHAVIQDVGIVAVELDGRSGYRLLIGGGLGTDPRLARELEPFTAENDLIVTVEAVLRVWDREITDRNKRTHVRLRHLVHRLGFEVLQQKVSAERDRLRWSSTYHHQAPQTLLPERVAVEAARGEGAARTAAASLAAPAAAAQDQDSFAAWLVRNAVAQHDPDRYAVSVTPPLGDVTAAQFRALAAASREWGVTWRTTIRQNLIARDVHGTDLPRLHAMLVEAGLDGPGADSAASIVSCPGSETCNLALTASRGLAAATAEALTTAGLADEHLKINISACPNSCGQQQLADIGLSGLVRRVGSDEAPGYRILLGGAAAGSDPAAGSDARFGRYVAKVPARHAPEALVALVGRYTQERLDDERFGAWVDRVDAACLGEWLATFDRTQGRAAAPELYTDWGATAPFEVILGRGECAT